LRIVNADINSSRIWEHTSTRVISMKVLLVQVIVDVVNADDVCTGLRCRDRCDIDIIEEKSKCIVEGTVDILVVFLRSKHVLE
jgi:hypothetical protein